MPVIKCAGCGGVTNTACSNHLFPVREDGKANECYAKREGNKWVKGCAYDDAPELTQRSVATLLKAGDENNFPNPLTNQSR